MDVQQQDQAYKRGLVLGLTMAEIILLVLFCLLLALAAIFARHREHMSWQEEMIAIQTQRIAELETTVEVDPADLRLVTVLKEYWERNAPPKINFSEYFSQLVLRIEELNQLRAELEELVEKTGDMQEQLALIGIDPTHEPDRRRLEAALTALDVIEAEGGDFDQLVSTIGGLRQLIGYYERRYGFPPCWHDEDWNIDYTFDAKLTTDGFVLRPLNQTQYADHPIMPAIRAVTNNTEITQSTFVIQTRPIYDWSVENECRFFVRVYDGTAEEEKRIFQERMRTLEGHFYKLALLNIDPPF